MECFWAQECPCYVERLEHVCWQANIFGDLKVYLVLHLKQGFFLKTWFLLTSLWNKPKDNGFFIQEKASWLIILSIQRIKYQLLSKSFTDIANHSYKQNTPLA